MNIGGVMAGLNSFVQLRRVLLDMEKDLGLREIPRIEKNVLVACAEAQLNLGEGEYSAIISHDLLVEESTSKIKQALRRLIDRKLISISDQPGKKIYQVQT